MKNKQTNGSQLTEIRFHGRGGQGAKTAAQVLGEAALHDNKYFQAFPQYGPERRGAAVTTFTRIAKHPINVRSQIHNPDYAVVLDDTLLNSAHVTQGLKSTGMLIINTAQKESDLRKKTRFEGEIKLLNGSDIASFFINKNIPNLVMVGALNQLTHLVDFEDLTAVLEKNFKEKWGEEMTKKNILAMKTGAEEVLQ